jgi:hypothetical protein
MSAPNNMAYFAHRLILHASEKAPAALSERLKEEWLADLECRSGAMAQLRLAIGCCWATAIIARDFSTPRFATCGASTAHQMPLRGVAQALMPPLSRMVVFALLAGVCVAGYAYSRHSCSPETKPKQVSSAMETTPKL